MTDTGPPKILGVHHLKLAATSLKTTEKFYNEVLGFKTIPELTHRRPNGDVYAEILQGPTGIYVEVRHHPEQAKAQRGWDPITWAVQGKADLQNWEKWFEAKGIVHSRVFIAVKGWMLSAEDPDGKHIHLYTLDSHEWTDNPDSDPKWIT